MPEDMDRESYTPAADFLFIVNNKVENLDKPSAEFSHLTVAQLLFLSKQACPDIQTAITFLMFLGTITQYKKLLLAHIIQYLWGTQNMYLTLEAKDLHVIKWYIDGSFAPEVVNKT